MTAVERLRKQLDEARAAIALLMSDYDDLLAELDRVRSAQTPGSEGDPTGGRVPPVVENGANDVASPEPRYPVHSAEVTVTYPTRRSAS